MIDFMENIFNGIFDVTGGTDITLMSFIIILVSSLFVGLVLAFAYMYKNKYTKSFVTTLALLPAVVSMVILMVNGNIGAGVAVAGAFSLVRFRSVPGSAKEIGTIFIAMAAGLALGMGYVAYAALFSIILGIVFVLYNTYGFKDKKNKLLDKTMTITIPEDLDYSGIFDDLFEKYTTSCELVKVKSTNMGSMFKLTYNLSLKNVSVEKNFIDELRCRNGNLEIVSSVQDTNNYEL